MAKNKIYIGALVILAILLLVRSASSTKVQSGNVIKIGSISALTGIGVGAGEEERNGALLAVEEINARGGVKVGASGSTKKAGSAKLELVMADLSFDKLKDAGVVGAKLIEIDKIVAAVGAQWDEPTEAIIPLFEKAGVPLVGADLTSNLEKDKDYPYLFSIWYDNHSGIQKILSEMQHSGIKKVTIIRPIDGGFWKYTADILAESAKSFGIEIVGDYKLSDPFTTDFRTTLSKIKNQKNKADAIFIVVTDPTQCPFLKQVQELEISQPIYGTEALGSYASLSKCSKAMEQMKFSSPLRNEKYQKFASKYEKRFGRLPQYPSAITAYDAVFVIASALEKTDGAGGEALRKAIQETKNLEASSQIINFNEKGYVVTPIESWEIDTVRDGKFIKVE